jgi:hypothetical protein
MVALSTKRRIDQYYRGERAAVAGVEKAPGVIDAGVGGEVRGLLQHYLANRGR